MKSHAIVSSTGSDIIGFEFLLFYFLKIFTPVAAWHIICGLWSLVPCRGSDPEETALTASDAVRVSRSRDSRGALVQMRVKPVPGGLSAGGAKTESGSEEGSGRR